MMSCSDVTPRGGPFVLTEHDAGEVLDLYARCIDYFMLQDGEPATLADAIELFRDVPEEKTAVDQIVMGWRGQKGLMAVVAILRDYPSNGVWYPGFMIVDAAARGKDIGRSIYDTIERWAANRGAQEIRLHLVRCRWCRCRSQRPASGRGSDPEVGAAPAGRGWWSTSPARPFVPRPPRRRLWQRYCRQGDASPLRPCPRRRASPGHRRSIESAGMTNEKRNAQRRFQRGDATAGGLRADAKVARGAAEPAASRDGHKASKIAPVHGSSISGKSISSIIHS